MALKPLTLPGIIQPSPNLGVKKKPNQCKLLCPYYSVGEGYIEDTLPPEAKIMVMITNPSSDDLLNGHPLTGKAGYAFFRDYVYPLGYGNDDVAITSVIRCRPPQGKFPLGQDKKGTMEGCRYYDQQKIKEFGPKSYLLTHALKDVYRENAFHTLLVSDIKKAFSFAEKGLRPIVLMGQEAAEMVAPYILGQGGVKKWRGQWQEIEEWPFLSASVPEKPKFGFTPARYKK